MPIDERSDALLSRANFAKMGKGKKGGKKKGAEEGKEADADGVGDVPVVVEESATTKRHRENIKNAFLLFDKEGEERVVQEDVRTVMRYLGQFPSDEEVEENILPTMQSDEPDAYVTLEKFEPRMLEIIEHNLYPAEAYDVLISAFRAVDTENVGYVEVEYFKELLKQMGTHPFKQKELESFLNVSQDISSGRIYYEDYASLCISQLDDRLAELTSVSTPIS
ncbi:Calmodulin [Hondaea fermentalgiana]|uniref:Calmodulin n=1 Tax=Hondaea fermentalgiana TaxID=2315210 RepID=A0A2R5GCU8_9STRA|nr:Calmodulin [Hondaea fermentalgiana]|eukprot:GBG27528.1 Calmodulin [Hondaea fermentalgiana]